MSKLLTGSRDDNSKDMGIRMTRGITFGDYNQSNNRLFISESDSDGYSLIDGKFIIGEKPISARKSKSMLRYSRKCML